MKHFQLFFFVLDFLLWSCAELSLASAIFQLSDRIKRCRRVRFVESYDSFFNIVLCYYYLQKNLHPVVHLFTQYSENSSQKWFQSSDTAQAPGPASVADTSVGSWGVSFVRTGAATLPLHFQHYARSNKHLEGWKFFCLDPDTGARLSFFFKIELF